MMNGKVFVVKECKEAKSLLYDPTGDGSNESSLIQNVPFSPVPMAMSSNLQNQVLIADHTICYYLQSRHRL
jgi:hypothetical protein